MTAAHQLAESFEITVWESLTNPVGHRQEETWETLLSHGWWRRPVVVADKVTSRGWSPATFAADRRAKAGVEAVHALVLDYEAPEGEPHTPVDDALDLWAGSLGLLHTSYSHSPERHRSRLVLALSRAVSAQEYPVLWRWAASRCAEAGHSIDEACRDPSRLWFLPAVPPGGEASYFCRRLDGGPLDVDAALAEQRQREAPPAPPPSTPRARREPSAQGLERFVEKALEGAADDVRRAPKGSRHNTIRAKAYQLAGLLHTGALDADQIERALMDAAKAAGWENEAKTRGTVRDQIKAGARAPRAVPELRYQPRAEEQAAAPSTPPSEGASEGEPVAEENDWHALLITRRGEVTSDLANLLAILEHEPHWSGRLRFNEARQQIEVAAQDWRTWQDHDDTDAAVWLQRTWKLRARPETVCQAVQALAQRKRCNPLADWLRSLRWDGVKRLDSWLVRYAGAKDSAYVRAAGACWLRGAVARALCPGVKVDAMLVLEGAQGAGKSSLFRVIGGEYFTDDVHDLASKDAALAVSRAWIVELPELSAMGRAEVELVKAFLSRQVDRFRPPYGRALVELSRRCIFGGTTNRADYLKDDTGNRRFHPVAIGVVELDALAADREQLLAEAVASWQAGEPLALPAEVRGEHAEVTEGRRQEDPWEGEVARWLVGKSSTSSAEVLGSALQIPTDRWTRSDQMRAGQILARLGWRKRRVRIGTALEWRYEKGGDDVPT